MKPIRNRSQMEVAFQHLEAHMLFICPECGETFSSQQQWRQHLNFHHDYLCKKPEDFDFVEINDRFHECQSCNVMVADGKRAIALLQYHRFLHLPFSRTYRCRHCPASFTRKRVLCEHLCRSHERIVGEKVSETASKKLAAGSTKEETTKPNKTEITKIADQLKNETSSYFKDNPEFYMRYICPQCGVLIENYKKWMVHIKTTHTDVIRSDCEMQRVSGTKNYYCKICRKVIFSNDNAKLQRHYFTHLPYKVNFHCTYCKVRRAYKTELLHHFIRTHIKEFETQRKYIRKPQEWGAEANEQLDKELDLLLEYGSGLSTKGPNSMKFTSTTISNSYSQAGNKKKLETEQQVPRCLIGREIENSSATSFIDEYIKETGISSSHSSQKRNWKEMKQKTTQNQQKNSKESMENSKSAQKNGLEALCAEIFGDIDELEVNEFKKSDKSYGNKATTNDQLRSSEENYTGQEQIVSIEINALDESELSKLDETETDQSSDNLMPKKRQKLNDSVETTKTSPGIKSTLKSLFNAKILHLCPKCGKSFCEQSVWRKHVLTAHENLNKMLENSYKLLDDQDSNLCLTCMQVLATMDKTELQRHCFTHMPYHAYLKCTLCGTAKSNKSKMLQHLETEHGSLLQKTVTMNTTKDIRSFNDKEIKQVVEKEKTLSPHLEKIEYSHLMKHLLNARDRLNRMVLSKPLD